MRRLSRSSRLAGLVAIGGLAACVAAAAPAVAAKHGFKVTPRVGGPTTAFKVSFRAPRAADGDSTDYILQGVGPRRCPSLFDFAGRVVRGKREVMRLTPLSIEFFDRSRWCPGTYVGVVYWSPADIDEDDVLIGYFRFGVRREPVSLE